MCSIIILRCLILKSNNSVARACFLLCIYLLSVIAYGIPNKWLQYPSLYVLGFTVSELARLHSLGTSPASQSRYQPGFTVSVSARLHSLGTSPVSHSRYQPIFTFSVPAQFHILGTSPVPQPPHSSPASRSRY